MEALAWTAIALLGATVLAMFGSVHQLGSRIDALSLRIDAQGAELGARIDALSSRIDSLESRLDARLDALSARLDDHIQRNVG